MIPSPEGLLVFAILFLLGYQLGSGPVIGLLASLSFGATAFASIPALGGSSPLIFSLFSCVLLLGIASRRNILRELGAIFRTFKTSWMVLILMIYALVSAILFPRFFEGKTTAFVVFEGNTVEVLLHAVSGNITQTAYFMLGALTFYAILIFLLRNRDNISVLYTGYFVSVLLNIMLGALDLFGKLAGAGDILSPIRTANYTFLTNVTEAGFSRIAGGFSEASTFAIYSLWGLAFSYMHWKKTGSVKTLLLTLLLLFLVLLSTSTTAYAGLMLLSLSPFFSTLKSIFTGHFHRQDFITVLMGAFLVLTVMIIFLYNEAFFSPIVHLFEKVVLNKADSSSAIGRFYWNERALQSFFDTSGLGIGMGSSRSSSWAISVISQLGVIGAALMLFCVGVILRGMRGLTATISNQHVFVFVGSVRAAMIAFLLALTISGSGSDPSVFFFISLATILGCRFYVEHQTDHPAP